MSKLFDDVLELLLEEISRSLNSPDQQESSSEDFLTFRPLEKEVFLNSSWEEDDNQ